MVGGAHAHQEHCDCSNKNKQQYFNIKPDIQLLAACHLKSVKTKFAVDMQNPSQVVNLTKKTILLF